ncbi:MAG: NADH dehydrogenase [ubiquinone] 1 alpha subcomplex assembly factor 1 [Planctomycetota bacterium]|jgi:NADH dehydrogenase [ubiquinone] 1 alpha subcomplex assembly factor 1
MEDRLLTDFGSKGMPLRWLSVEDGVMGGLSSCSFRVVDAVLQFSGVLNTNGGGFASIRTRPTQLGLEGMEGVHLRVKGGGRTYSARLQDSDGMRAASYRAEFETTKTGEWQDVWLPFRSFRASWRGRDLDRPPIDPAEIQTIGITIADKIDGAFLLEVDSIAAYAPSSMKRDR